jgi:hypothetical protein
MGNKISYYYNNSRCSFEQYVKNIKNTEEYKINEIKEKSYIALMVAQSYYEKMVENNEKKFLMDYEYEMYYKLYCEEYFNDFEIKFKDYENIHNIAQRIIFPRLNKNNNFITVFCGETHQIGLEYYKSFSREIYAANNTLIKSDIFKYGGNYLQHYVKFENVFDNLCKNTFDK